MSLLTNHPVASGQSYESRIELIWENNIPTYRAFVQHEAAFISPEDAAAFVRASEAMLPIYEAETP